MNVDAFRHFYDYHFALNRFIWTQYIVPLSQEQFIQPVDYSHGSVRDQIVHLMDVDEAWFGDLQGAEIVEPLDPAKQNDRGAIRAHWDIVEQNMREYLANLRDELLSTQPLHGEDENLFLWQVLLHVVNHGTDHRAQILRALHDLGVDTTAQDYIFYVYEHP